MSVNSWKDALAPLFADMLAEDEDEREDLLEELLMLDVEDMEEAANEAE